MARGGYQRPGNPAAVSGPGRLARRTDGGPASQSVAALPNAGYGEGAEFEAVQSAAPMSASPPPAAPPTGRPGPDALGGLMGTGGSGERPPTPFSAPTERPEEPLTAGAPFGPGPGPAPELLAPPSRLSDVLERLLEHDITGEIQDMYVNVRRRGL